MLRRGFMEKALTNEYISASSDDEWGVGVE